MSHFDFEAIIAWRGYHMYKETAWSDAIVNDKVKLEIETNQSLIAIDTYACAVSVDGWNTVGHASRAILRYIYSFIKKEDGKVSVNVKSLNNKTLTISSEGLEVPLLLTISCPEEWFRNKMKDFINDSYTYDFTGIIHNDSSSGESDIEVDLELNWKRRW